jgi:hypothetical protein
MRTIKLLLAAVVLAMSTLSLQAQDGKTLVRSLDPAGNNAIVLDFGFPVSGEEWDQNTMRVLLDVKLVNGSEDVLSQLVKVGRYTVEGRIENGKFIVYAPSILKEVTVKGVKMEEQFKATIYVPSGAEVSTAKGDVVQIESIMAKKLAAQGLAMKGEPVFKPFDVTIQISAMVPNDPNFSPSDILIDGKPIGE